MTWAWGPFLSLDFESTGIDIETARIVQYGLVHIDGPSVHVQTELVDPREPIPAEATDVHGITDEMVQEGGLDTKDALSEVVEAIDRAEASGAALVVFNAPYDLSLLDRELMRVTGKGLDYDNLPLIIDPLVLVNRMAWKRPHNLEHACEVWKVPAGGHDAGQDALAAARLLWRLAQEMRVQLKKEDQEYGDGGLIWRLDAVPLAWLQRAQARWYRESAEGFIQNQLEKGRDVSGVNLQWPIIRRPRLVKETA